MEYPNRGDLAKYWNEVFDGTMISDTITGIIEKEESLLKETHGLKNLRIIKRNASQIKESKYGSQKKSRADIDELV